MKFERIGLVGYGEVGKIFSAGLAEQARRHRVSAWDLKFAHRATQARNWRMPRRPASERMLPCRRCARPAS